MKITTTLSGFFKSVFGVWTRPVWMNALGLKLSAFKLKHPKVLPMVGIALVILIVAGGTFTWWSKHRPQPQYVAVTVVAPSLTTIVDDQIKIKPLVFKFEKSVARLDQVGRVVDRGIGINPACEGTWSWESDSKIFFQPKNDWPADQTYKVTFDRSLFAEQVKLRTYSYEVVTPSFFATIAKFDFYQDPIDPKIKRLVGTVTLTHPVDQKSFESNVLIRRAGDGDAEIQRTVKYNKYLREAYVSSDVVEPGDTDKFAKLIINSGVKPQNGQKATSQSLEKQATIPSIENFFRVDAMTSTIVNNPNTSLPEQILVLTTRDGAISEEVFKNLEAYLLPKDQPASDDQDAVKDYEWSGPEEVTDEVLKQSQKISVELIPSEKRYSRAHTFRFKQPPGRFLYVFLNKGIKSFGGYLLPLDYHEVVGVPVYPREIRIMHEGSLLTLQGERKLSLLLRGVDAVKIKFNRIVPEQINNLLSLSDGNFSDPDLSYNCYDYGLENISEIFSETEEFPANRDPALPIYRAVDFSKHLAVQNGLFVLEVREWDPATNEELSRSDRRLVLISDMGLITKKMADGAQTIFVQSVKDGTPVSGATVEVIGKNGLPLVSKITDGDGRADLGYLDEFENEKKPIAFLARKDADFSLLPYNAESRQLELSRFDVDGVMLYGKDQLKANVFSDRGIYRPGETIKAGIIVRSTNFDSKLLAVPLEVVVKDARGLVAQRSKLTLPASGFFDISYQTDPVAATGTYTVNVYLVKDKKDQKEENVYLGSTSVRVEEFQPDQMKITSQFSSGEVKGWVSPEALKGIVLLANLYGAPATARRVKAKIELTPAFPRFPAFADYLFFNPAKLEKRVEEDLTDQKTDDKGSTTFDLDLGRYAQATYRLRFSAEGFSTDEGGRSVKTDSNILVSPFKALMGYKADAELSMLHKGSQHTVHFLAVDSSLAQIVYEGLKKEVVERRYVSTLIQQSDETYKYQSVLKEIPVSSADVNIPVTGMIESLSTDKPGDFEIRFVTPDGTKVCQVNYTVAGQANLARSMEKSAELQLTLNKKEYLPGEEIEVSIKAPYAGAGLITIERDHVSVVQWFKTETNSTVQKIRIPDNFDGNGYVNVAFVRSTKSEEIFTNPLSYGVVPFAVSLEPRKLNVSLSVPELVEPGQKLTVSYAVNRPAQIVVFGVDEGILQYAGYPTPDPLADFFAKRALEVTTYQTLDLILPEYSVVKKLFSPAGDQGFKYIGNNLNPFKRKTNPPVVFWSGVVDVDDAERELTFDVPDYFFGAMRVMAVAVAADGIGVAEKKTTVKGPFVINPTAPLFVAPGDIFETGLVVANNVKGSGKEASIVIEAVTGEALQVVGEKTQTVVIGENTEKAITFKYKTLDKLGDAKLTFVARVKDRESRSSVSLSVRPPVPYVTTVKTGHFKSGTVDVTVDRSLYPNYRKHDVGISPVPLILSQGLVRYLVEFPYGCTEQVVSQALPAVVLKDTTEFGYDPQKINTVLTETLRKLRSRQNADGSFNYWPATGLADEEDSGEDDLSDEEGTEEEWQDISLVETDAFLSIYVFDFLQEAKKHGFAVPTDMLQNVRDYLKKVLRSNIASAEDAKLYAYATYLLTRDGIVTSDYLANLTEYLDGNLEDWKNTIIGPYVAASYQLLQKSTEAQELIKEFSLENLKTLTVVSYYNDSFIDKTQYVSLLSQHFPQILKKLPAEDLLTVVDEIIQGRFNTIRAAYAVRALRAYSDAAALSRPQNLAAKETTIDGKANVVALTTDLFARGVFSGDAKSLAVSGQSDRPIFYQVVQAGFDRSIPDTEIKSGLEIYREYTNDKGQPVTQIKIGADIFVHLKVRSLGDTSAWNLVIVDLLPGGFEKTDDPTSGTFDSTFVDVREDRVLVFGSADKDVKEFVYKVKAVSKGEFIVPPPLIESMYDQDLKARGKGGKVVVE